MTAKDMISKAIVLLGYNDDRGNTSDSRFQIASKTAVNSVMAELFYCLNNDGFKEIEALSDEIKLPERVLYNIMPYGVASLIAESIGDADKQAYFGAIYNRRLAQLSHSEPFVDEIPYPEY